MKETTTKTQLRSERSLQVGAAAVAAAHFAALGFAAGAVLGGLREPLRDCHAGGPGRARGRGRGRESEREGK